MALALCFGAVAGEKKADKPWFADVSVGGVAGIRQSQFTGGHSEIGAGVQLGMPLNNQQTVKAELRLMAFEDSQRGNERDHWKGDTIDEVAVGAKYTLLSSSNKRIRLDGGAGFDRSQQLDDFGFHVGASAVLAVNKRLEFAVSREVRSWFRNDHDHLTLVSGSYKF